MRTALDYLRRHAIAVLALICSLLALAGASYATLRLPAGSVGARQLRDNSITPDKFNHKVINGAVRAWAIVSATGRLIAGGGGPVIRRNPTLPASTWFFGGSISRTRARRSPRSTAISRRGPSRRRPT